MSTEESAVYICILNARRRDWPVATWLRAPYRALHSIWSHDGETQLDLGNYYTAWFVEEQAHPEHTFFIHDSRDDGKVDENRSAPDYEWHVHGPDEASLTAFCRWLSAQVVNRCPRRLGRRMTAQSRERVNQKIREGSSPTEAAASADWEVVEAGEDYSWPIAGRVPIEEACW